MVDRQSQGYRAGIAVEHKVLGAAFLGLLLLGAWYAYAVFNKAFTDYDEVTLLASKTGLQLPERADVKLRGVIVGEVLAMRSTAEGAELTLGLHPSRRATVPAGVSARILPKTLFGEKYVALQAPKQTNEGGLGAEAIQPGATIEETEVAIEVERVLNDMYPLLRTVQPAEINHTLTAMATALEGRGDTVGENLVVLNDYLQRTNPQLPLLIEDLRLLGDVSDVYRAAMPRIARMLRNSVTTGNTFREKEQRIQSFFSDVSAFSSTSRDFLEANGDNIIRLAEVSVPQLRLYAKYAPEYPCLLQAQHRWIPRSDNVWRGHTLHINLEPLPRQPRGYGTQDDAVYGDRRGPHDEQLCRRAIDGEWGQHNLPPAPPDIDDGVDNDSLGKRPRAATGPGVDMTSGYGGTEAEREVVNAVAAPVIGVPSEQVPDIASLLFAPLARGAEVELR